MGEWKKSVELPHTITNWVGRALCVSESHGFGMSSPSEIEAFQPFFLELHLPYSVKRTEKLKLKVSVFNYATQSLPIRLTLAQSETIQLVPNGNDSLIDYSAQLCILPKSNLVHHFVVYANQLGRHNVTVSAAIDDLFPTECGSSSVVFQGARDSVVKELLVQPEGFPVERLYSHMACPKGKFNSTQFESINWHLISLFFFQTLMRTNLSSGICLFQMIWLKDLQGPGSRPLATWWDRRCRSFDFILSFPQFVQFNRPINWLSDRAFRDSFDCRWVVVSRTWSCSRRLFTSFAICQRRNNWTTQSRRNRWISWKLVTEFGASSCLLFFSFSICERAGYQRELTYRHDDGSYSAFGKNDREGSLWLTAFVVKSFAAARRFIHVDEKELKTSVNWLISKQQSNGCFPAIGTLLNQDLKVRHNFTNQTIQNQ